MPRYRHNPDTGQNYVYRQGRWQEVSQQEVDINQAGLVGDAVSFIQGFNPAAPFTEGGQAALNANPIISQLPLLAGGAGIVRGGVGRMSQRVAGQLTQQVPGQGFRTASGMLRRPQDMVPEELAGVVRGFESGIEATPGLRILTDQIRLDRQRQAGNALGRWLGINSDVLVQNKNKLLPEVMEDALSTTDEMYTSISSTLDDTMTRAQVDELLEDAVKRKLIIPDKKAQYDELLDISEKTAQREGRGIGQSVIDLRSELRTLARTADNTETQNIDIAIQNIQKTIDEVLEGTDAGLISREADKRYARWMLVKQGKAIRDDGTVSRAALMNIFRRENPREMIGNRAARDDDTQLLFDRLKDWSQMGPEMPSSGTAERTAAYNFLMSMGAFGTGAAIF